MTDVDWNPHVENQAEDRVWRIGQIKLVQPHQINIAKNLQVTIYKLKTDSLVDPFKAKIQEVIIMKIC